MKTAARVGLGLIAAFLAVAVLGPLAAIIVFWFISSPDGVAAAGRAGGVGAIGAGASAAGKSMASEWRRGGPARRRRRSDRRDRMYEAGGWQRKALAAEHAAVLAWRGVATSLAALVLAGKAMPGAYRAAVDAVNGRSRPAALDETEPDSDSDADPNGRCPQCGSPMDTRVSSNADGTSTSRLKCARCENESAQASETEPTDSRGQQVAGEDPAEPTTGETMSETTVGSGELQTTGDLRAEVVAIQAVIERATIRVGVLRDWQKALPDTYVSGHANGGPSTRALDEAVAAVSEVKVGAQASTFAEALIAIRLACNQADSFGDHADSMGAEGHTKGFATT